MPFNHEPTIFNVNVGHLGLSHILNTITDLPDGRNVFCIPNKPVDKTIDFMHVVNSLITRAQKSLKIFIWVRRIDLFCKLFSQGD